MGNIGGVMAEQEKCKECRFFYGKPLCTGYCKRHAPVYTDKPQPQGFNYAWPMVQPDDDTCGDFEPKGDK